MTKYLAIKPDRNVEVLELDGVSDLQQVVGGLVQYVHAGDVDAIVNEEGIMQDLPFNVPATGVFVTYYAEFFGEYAAKWWLQDNGLLRGTVLFTGPPDGEGNATDVPASMIERYAP